MKRKVIQIANSTQLISLPHKWAQKHKIKKGDELEITEAPGKLTITPNLVMPSEQVEVDVTGLDRTSILLLVRGLYKRGYEEIRVICNNTVVPHYRTQEQRSFLSVIHTEVNRLPGVEVIEQKDNHCVIKAISEPTLKDIDTVMRRIIMLINDAANDVIVACKTQDRVLLETIEEKHDTISKFTSFISRLLNAQDSEEHLFLLSIVCLLDKVMDFIKNTSRIALDYGKKIKPETAELMELTYETFQIYQKIHFKIDTSLVTKMSKLKEEVQDSLIQISKIVPKEDILIASTFQSALECYRGIVELRLAMAYPSHRTSLPTH